MITEINERKKIKDSWHLRKFQTPGNQQCRQMNCLTAETSIMESLDNTYYSVPGVIIQSHCNLAPKRLDLVTFKFGYMFITD